jgi:AcrR family transcriptional regulator
VSKGLLYHYFPTKRDFYVATLREAADALVVETQPPEELPPLERLWSGLDAYLRFAERHAPAYVGLLRGGIGSDPEVALVVEGTRRALAERVSSAVGASAGPALRLAVRGWVGYVEATSLEWLERPDVPRSELLSSWVALLAWLVPGHALADVAAG